MPRQARLVSACAVATGGLLYLVGRAPTLRMFGWLEAVGLGRGLVTESLAWAPAWILLSLPFALWVFAAALVARGTKWWWSVPVLAIGSELGQLGGAIPGTFDPIDLGLLVVAAGLGSGVGLGSTRPHAQSPMLPVQLRPAIAISMFAFLSLATSEDPAAKAEREKREAEALAGLEAYQAGLAAVHTKLSALDLDAQKETACDGPTMLEAPAVEHGHLNLRTVSLGFLARFGGDKAAWTKPEKPWDFIDDSTFAGHFESHKDDRTPYALKDTAKRVEETFLAERYLIVVTPTSADSMVAPVMQKKHFDPGYFDGWMFIVDQSSGEIACQAHVVAESGDFIDFGGMLDSNDPSKEMMEDFEDNLEAALLAKLPNKVGISTLYGSILF